MWGWDISSAIMITPPAVLQREVTLLEHAVADVDGLLAVECHNEMPPIGGNLIGVPLVGGLWHRGDLSEIDKRTGALAPIKPRVEVREQTIEIELAELLLLDKS